MKSDVQFYYVTKCDQHFQVEVNIEGVELKVAELNEKVGTKPATFLTEVDLDELIEVLTEAKKLYTTKKSEGK